MFLRIYTVFIMVALLAFDSVSQCYIVELAVENVTCNGADDGKIVLDHSSSCISPVTFSWAHGASGPAIYDLSPGLYEVTMTDYSGNNDYKNWLITEPSVINPNPASVEPFCHGYTDGQASVYPDGGTPPYNYLWFDGSTNNYVGNLGGGNYMVTVTDDNGCSVTSTVVLFDPPPVEITVIDFDNISCVGFNDGHISVEGSGGTDPYYYNWSTGDDVSELDDLPTGYYTVTVSDLNLCTVEMGFSVFDPAPISVTFPIINDLECANDGSGSIEIYASGGTGQLSYNWSNGATTNIINNLQAGTFDLTITDANNCTYTDSYTVNEPTSIVVTNPLITDVDCNGNATGSITVNPSGGTPSYTYSWSNGGTNNTINNLTGGTYSLTITDANNCTYIDSYTVNEPTSIVVTNPLITAVDCNGNATGSITVNPSGGTPSYTYNWSNGGTNNTINNLTGGTYSLTITDANNCTFTDSYTVNEPTSIVVTNPIITDVDCNGNATGSITVNPTGGTPSYTYNWSNGGTNSTINSLTGGTYNLTITDSNNCTFTDSYTVNEPTSIVVTNPIITDVDCNGNATGSITVNPTGGTPSYTYNWSNGGTNNTISNLTGGTYNLTITDANNCTFTDSYTVNEPTSIVVTNPLITDVDCNGNATGSITVNPSGGVPSYTYNWSNGGTNNTINNLTGGTYNLTITDANNCTFTNSYTVNEPTSIVVTNPLITDVDCNGNATGSITVNPSGGTPIYTYNWSNGGINNTINNLTGGSYNLTITDVNNCTFTDSYTVNEPTAISVVDEIENVDCGSGATGSISVTPMGGAGNYNYLWSNGKTDSLIVNLTTGSYNVTITDNDGCILTKTYFVAQPSDIDITNSDITHNQCFGDEEGSISLAVTGGFGDLTYAWSNGDTTLTIDELEAGNFSVTITDQNDCNLESTFGVNSPEKIETPYLKVTDVSCFGEETGEISLLPKGGVAPFLIEWTYMPFDGGANEINELKEVIDTVSHAFGSGMVEVTLTDFNSCVEELAPLMIAQPDQLVSIGSESTNVPCYGDSTGIAEIILGGGVAPYIVEWTYIPENGSENQVEWTYNVIDTAAITFGVGAVVPKATDKNGCQLDVPKLLITEPDPLNYDGLTASSPICAGDSSGQIQFVITGGTSPYLIEWTYLPQNGGEKFVKWTYNVEDTASISFPAGIVQPIITDANGCELEVETINISEQIPIMVKDFTVEDALCFGDTSGLISFGIEGGIAPFIIEWTYMPFGDTASYVEEIINTSGLVQNNFGAGEVAFVISDVNGCTYDMEAQKLSYQNEIKVSQLDVFPPTCGQDSSGIINILLEGGSSPYAIEWTYTPTGGSEVFIEWTYNVTGLTVFNFGPGTVSGYIEDANGCSFQVDEIILENIDGPAIKEIKVTYNDGLGNIDLDLESFTGNLTFEWKGPNGFTSSDQNLSKLEHGTYSCVITDEKGCQTSTGNIEIIISSNGQVRLSEEVFMNSLVSDQLEIQSEIHGKPIVSCFNLSGQSLFTHVLEFGLNHIDVTKLTPGIYLVKIQHENQIHHQLISKH